MTDATNRYEVREDVDVDPRVLANYPGRRWVVWDTQTDSAYRLDLSDSHPDDAASVVGGAPRFGPVSEEYARETVAYLNAGPVEVHEDNSGAVYLTRHGITWALGPVTPDMAGQAAHTAWSWCSGTWEPNAGDGQSLADIEDLTLIATWRTDGTLTIEKNHHDEPVASAGGARFLGIEQP